MLFERNSAMGGRGRVRGVVLLVNTRPSFSHLCSRKIRYQILSAFVTGCATLASHPLFGPSWTLRTLEGSKARKLN